MRIFFAHIRKFRTDRTVPFLVVSVVLSLFLAGGAVAQIAGPVWVLGGTGAQTGIWFKNTNDAQFVMANPAAARTITFLDPGANASVKYLIGHVTITPSYGAIGTSKNATFTGSVTNAITSNSCYVTPSGALTESIIVEPCFVSSAGTVTLTLSNVSTASITPSAPTSFLVEVWGP